MHLTLYNFALVLPYDGNTHFQLLIFISPECAAEGESCGPEEMRCCDGLKCPLPVLLPPSVHPIEIEPATWEWPPKCVPKTKGVRKGDKSMQLLST